MHRKTIEDMQQLAQSHDGKCLSESYRKWCPQCKGMYRTADDMQTFYVGTLSQASTTFRFVFSQHGLHIPLA